MAGPRTPRGRAKVVVARLAEAYPGSADELCALAHDGPFQLLVATILSAQCTDARVNMVTPGVFAAYPDPEALAGADPAALEALIRSTGFFRAKARSLIGMARGVVERFDGAVPSDLDELVTLPGVGRKTANVVRSVAFGLPGLPVDTHVGRLSRRLGLTDEQDPVRVEHDLDAMVPAAERGALSLRLILHGRAVCAARAPRCGECLLADVCPKVGVAGTVGTAAGTRTRRPSRAAARSTSGARSARGGRSTRGARDPGGRATRATARPPSRRGSGGPDRGSPEF